MVFKPSQKCKSHDIQLLINDYKLDQVKETIFLGVILDENVNWSEISHVANKVSKSIGIIRKSHFYLSTKSLRTLYFSLVYPYIFFYCNLVWASTYKSNLVRLEILQKRVVRTIAKTDLYAHTDPILRNLGILKFHDMHLLQLGLFMYSHQNRTLQKEIQSYHTRNSHLYIVCLSVELTSNNFPFFTKDLNFTTPWVSKSSTRPPLSPLKKHLRRFSVITTDSFHPNVLRPSLREDQAELTHAISPFSMKLCQVEGTTQYLWKTKWTGFMIFPLGVRPPPLVFCPKSLSKISLKFASNLDITLAYRIHWILLVLHINKDWTYPSLHQEFQVIWRDRCQSRIVISYSCHSTFSYDTN